MQDHVIGEPGADMLDGCPPDFLPTEATLSQMQQMSLSLGLGALPDSLNPSPLGLGGAGLGTAMQDLGRPIGGGGPAGG